MCGSPCARRSLDAAQFEISQFSLKWFRQRYQPMQMFPEMTNVTRHRRLAMVLAHTYIGILPPSSFSSVPPCSRSPIGIPTIYHTQEVEPSVSLLSDSVWVCCLSVGLAHLLHRYLSLSLSLPLSAFSLSLSLSLVISLPQSLSSSFPPAHPPAMPPTLSLNSQPSRLSSLVYYSESTVLRCCCHIALSNRAARV
jgi:hypothetical protein